MTIVSCDISCDIASKLQQFTHPDVGGKVIMKVPVSAGISEGVCFNLGVSMVILKPNCHSKTKLLQL
jgi:hypothetical protein